MSYIEFFIEDNPLFIIDEKFKTVVRGKKKIRKKVAPKGYRIGPDGKPVRITGAEKVRRKKGAKRAARTKKSKGEGAKHLATKRRKKSMKKRKQLGIKNKRESIIIEATGYYKILNNFINGVWQEDNEINFIELVNEYYKDYSNASPSAWKNYLKRLLKTNRHALQTFTDKFIEYLQDLGAM